MGIRGQRDWRDIFLWEVKKLAHKKIIARNPVSLWREIHAMRKKLATTYFFWYLRKSMRKKVAKICFPKDQKRLKYWRVEKRNNRIQKMAPRV
jgi:hypothetical protein